jgi:zinc protease
MNSMRMTWLIILLLMLCGGSALAQDGKLKLPPSKKVKLANGLTLILMEQHEVPFVTFDLLVRAGSVADPTGKEGVASITGDMLRKGTKTRTATQISDQIDFVGGSLFVFTNHDYSSARAQFLKKDLNFGLEILTDVLINPTFPQEEFAKLQKQSIDSISEIKDNPGGAIPLYYNAYLFGNHPYGRPINGDERSLAAIKREDLVNFYNALYAPDNMTLAVVGDFATDEMERLLRERFGGWNKKAAQQPSKLAEAQPFQGKKLLFVNKPDATQTYFIIGNTGVSATNPDRVGIEIINTLFGVRFTSMLNLELRIKSGLTYGARSAFSQRMVAGPFSISTFTRNATTEQAIDMALGILKRLHEQGITEEQLKATKAYIKGQYAPDIEPPEALAALLNRLEFYGLDEREINEYFARIDAFTLADAKRVIQNYFPAENLVFVLLGKGEEVGNLVKKYAPKVEMRDISQPGFN